MTDSDNATAQAAVLSRGCDLYNSLFYEGKSMITSSSNAKVKQVIQWQNKGKERKKDGVFVAEGLKMFQEAPLSWICEVYVSDVFWGKLCQDTLIWKKLHQTGCEIVAQEIFTRMSDTQTPQGVLTVLRQPRHSLEQLLKHSNPLLLLLEDLQDPGNLGTIIRTGEGAGITGIVMTDNTVDIFNPKTIRSTMGSVYRVPFVHISDMGQTIRLLQQYGINTYAAHLNGKAYYDSFSFREPTAFLIGNEGRGLKESTANLADSYLKIPMEGEVESLNAAIAASLLMYEAHRQRLK